MKGPFGEFEVCFYCTSTEEQQQQQQQQHGNNVSRNHKIIMVRSPGEEMRGRERKTQEKRTSERMRNLINCLGRFCNVYSDDATVIRC